MLRLWIQYMLEIPGRQEIDTVHGGDRNVGGISRFRRRYRLTLYQQLSERLSLGWGLKQRDAVEFGHSFRCGGWIARTTFVQHQV